MYSRNKSLKRLIFDRVELDSNCCWVWLGVVDKNGYAKLHAKVDGTAKQMFAHRLSFCLFSGVIPEGLVLDHLCRNRRCVNPTHLEPVTYKENCRRGKKGILRDKLVNNRSLV